MRPNTSFWGSRRLHDGLAAARQRASAGLASLAPLLASPTGRVHELDADTLACQLRLARIPSPTGNESARAADFLRTVRTSGWTNTRIDGVGNVIARHRAERVDAAELAPVVCMAHLDTVFPLETSLALTHEGARVTCPGIGDNCRGLAGVLTLAHVLGEMNDGTTSSPLRRPIELVATVGEEGLGNLRGASEYFASRAKQHAWPPHAVVVLDGPGDARIVHHALGSRRYRIAFHGQGGHSWADFGSPNAAHAAGRAISWLAELPRGLSDRLALTVSGIGGGESVNSIPMHAWLDVDLRATSATLLERGEADLHRIVLAAVASERRPHDGADALTCSIETVGTRPCGELAVDHPLVALAGAATRAQGLEPVSAIASTDANVPLSLGIPAITIGAGGVGGAAHTVHEWYENTHAPRGLARALAIVVALAA